MKEYYTMFCDYFISNPSHYLAVAAAVFVICLICITFYGEKQNKVVYAKPDPTDHVFAIFISSLTGLLWPIIIISLGTLLIAVVPIWIGKGIFYLKYGSRKRD